MFHANIFCTIQSNRKYCSHEVQVLTYFRQLKGFSAFNDHFIDWFAQLPFFLDLLTYCDNRKFSIAKQLSIDLMMQY